MNAILTQSQLNRLVETTEHRNQQFQEKYDSMSVDAKKIFNQLSEILYKDSKEKLNEAWYNTLGDVVGIFDPTGLVDIANGLSYVYQGDYFFGMLSMISAIPYVGDAVAKPLMLAGKGSKLIKNTDIALKLAKAGKTVEATKIISDAAKSNSIMAKLFGAIRRWSPKLKQIIDKIPGGKLSSGLRNTLKDWISLFEKVGSGTQKASAIARRAIKNPLTQRETISTLQKIKSAVKQDGRLFREFGGSGAKGLQGIKNYKASGVPRLFGNKATRSLMVRTKFWFGFLDYLGLGNFVGVDELKNKMGTEFDEKMNQYSQTTQAQKNWNDEFGNVPDETIDTETSTQTQTPNNTSSDMTKDFLTNMIFGPLTGKFA